MKKLLLSLLLLAAMLTAGIGLKAQEITITLNPGWNWISYPNAEAMELASALGDFVPANGDRLKLRDGSAQYGNGRWRGNFSNFMPGLGYMYYSARTESTSFIFAQAPSPQVPSVITADPTAITPVSAVVGGTMIVPIGCRVIMYGVCWDTDSIPKPNIFKGTYNPKVTDICNASFSDTLVMESNTTYYVRAFVVFTRNDESVGVKYGEVKNFTPLITITASADPSTGGSVSGGGTYNYGETATLTATANNGYTFIGWSDGVTDNPRDITVMGPAEYTANFQFNSYFITATANPTVGGSVTGGGTYNHGETATLTATANTGYTFIGWSDGVTDNPRDITITGSAEYTANFQLNGYLITATANPTAGGSVTGGGTYNYGDTCTLIATPATGYTFYRWKKGTGVIYANPYTFTVTGSASYVAVFTTSQNVTLPTVTTNQVTNITQTTATGGGNVTSGGNATVTARGVCWSTSHNPTTSNNHTTDGTGTGSFTSSITGLTANTTYYVRAYATNSAGTAYGSEISFTTTGSGGNVPTGAINGKFTINSSGDKVYFSQGNLQYIGSASTPYWKFADHQWDCLGDNGQGSTSTTVDRDLFGWGTSGYNHGAVCYQPWKTSINNAYYKVYGSYTYNLYNQTGKADWGYNKISNGGNTEHSGWRTLTKPEWFYVLFQRTTISDKRFAKANVNNVNGIILLPDDWNLNYYSLNGLNGYSASFSTNIITSSQWSTYLEPHGAVFLPAAGYRYETSVYDVDSYGYYWSASSKNDYAYRLQFKPTYVNPEDNNARSFGHSVRLVRPAQN